VTQHHDASDEMEEATHALFKAYNAREKLPIKPVIEAHDKTLAAQAKIKVSGTQLNSCRDEAVAATSNAESSEGDSSAESSDDDSEFDECSKPSEESLEESKEKVIQSNKKQENVLKELNEATGAPTTDRMESDLAVILENLAKARLNVLDNEIKFTLLRIANMNRVISDALKAFKTDPNMEKDKALRTTNKLRDSHRKLKHEQGYLNGLYERRKDATQDQVMLVEEQRNDAVQNQASGSDGGQHGCESSSTGSSDVRPVDGAGEQVREQSVVLDRIKICLDDVGMPRGQTKLIMIAQYITGKCELDSIKKQFHERGISSEQRGKRKKRCKAAKK